MRSVLFAISLLASSSAFAGPTLTADPYPSTGPQPTSIGVTVNGSPAPAVTCTLPKNAANAVTPTCDLASLAPGNHTIVMMVSNTANCPNPTSPATCISGGSVSSAPFVLTLLPGLATSPVLRVAP